MQNKTLTTISRALDWPEGYLTDVLLSGRRREPLDSPQNEDPILTALHRVEQQVHEVSQQLTTLSAQVGNRPQSCSHENEPQAAVC